MIDMMINSSDSIVPLVNLVQRGADSMALFLVPFRATLWVFLGIITTQYIK